MIAPLGIGWRIHSPMASSSIKSAAAAIRIEPKLQPIVATNTPSATASSATTHPAMRRERSARRFFLLIPRPLTAFLPAVWLMLRSPCP